MSYCVQCGWDISPDCFLTNDRCVFCYYKTDKWESNGHIVTRQESIDEMKRVRKIWKAQRKKL